jgi:uroporphyrinogen decarboxylase
MKPFDKKFSEINSFIHNEHKPDFKNLLNVLKRNKPSRHTLFEFFLNDSLYSNLTREITYDLADPDRNVKRTIDGYHIAGYDYTTIVTPNFDFYSNQIAKNGGEESISMNEGGVIFDKQSFQDYKWPDPLKADYNILDRLAGYLPDGMKFISYGPCGILENVTKLVGYENLCFMSFDDPELLQQIFDEVGTRFVEYYRICSGYDSVGALISNDDWGFCNQTFMSTKDMRKYVIPWHKKIAETIHKSGKPVILHSCGKLDDVMDDIIDVIHYDAKHSYEDNITPVEQAYKKYGNRIAILGGIDLDFLCRSTPKEVYNRAVALLKQSDLNGGYALGSGNSIPHYVPQENYLAMIAAAVFNPQ